MNSPVGLCAVAKLTVSSGDTIWQCCLRSLSFQWQRLCSGFPIHMLINDKCLYWWQKLYFLLWKTFQSISQGPLRQAQAQCCKHSTKCSFLSNTDFSSYISLSHTSWPVWVDRQLQCIPATVKCLQHMTHIHSGLQQLSLQTEHSAPSPVTESDLHHLITLALCPTSSPPPSPDATVKVCKLTNCPHWHTLRFPLWHLSLFTPAIWNSQSFLGELRLMNMAGWPHFQLDGHMHAACSQQNKTHPCKWTFRWLFQPQFGILMATGTYSITTGSATITASSAKDDVPFCTRGKWMEMGFFITHKQKNKKQLLGISIMSFPPARA